MSKGNTNDAFELAFSMGLCSEFPLASGGTQLSSCFLCAFTTSDAQVSLPVSSGWAAAYGLMQKAADEFHVLVTKQSKMVLNFTQCSQIHSVHITKLQMRQAIHSDYNRLRFECCL